MPQFGLIKVRVWLLVLPELINFNLNSGMTA